MRIAIILVSVFSLAILFSSCKEERRDKRVLKLGHSLDVNHPVHKGMVHMTEILAKKSDGKLTIKIYPGGQLGNERQLLELLQIGGLDMTKVSASIIENFAPKYKVLGLPYIFRDKTHSHRVLDGDIGEELLLDGAKYWLRGLCFYDAGARSFYTIDKPILNPEDLEGLKIRVMRSNTPVQMVDAMGGSPTPISYGELYTSLQQRVVDGAENNPPSFYTSHHYEVCKHYALDEHTAVPDVLLISTHTWDKLSKQEQQWVSEAAKESVAQQRIIWDEFEKMALEEVQKAGVTIYYPDKSTFFDKVQEIHDEFRQDEMLNDLIERIIKL